MLPWKTQKIEDKPPEIDYFCKSLPPLPSGHFWECQENGEWVLFRMPVNETSGLNSMEFTKPSIFEHVVMPTDTLQGICLRYRVTAVNLRRMNMFSGNNIQFKKALLIPVEGGSYVQFQQNTEEVVLQKFRNATHEGVAESRLYLDEHNWDLDVALSAWKKDENWIDESEKEGMIIPPVPVLDIPDEDDIEDDNAAAADSSAIAPAAVSIGQVTAPAFISTVHPSQIPVAQVVVIEMSSMENVAPLKVPLLA